MEAVLESGKVSMGFEGNLPPCANNGKNAVKLALQ